MNTFSYNYVESGYLCTPCDTFADTSFLTTSAGQVRRSFVPIALNQFLPSM